MQANLSRNPRGRDSLAALPFVLLRICRSSPRLPGGGTICMSDGSRICRSVRLRDTFAGKKLTEIWRRESDSEE